MSIDQSFPPSATQRSESPEQRFLNYACHGDKAIIQSLVREFADQSYNQARRIIGREEGAEDAVQDAYLRLVTTAKRYDGTVPFAAWLGRLVNSAASDYRRKLPRHKNLTDLSDQGAAAMNDHADRGAERAEPEFEALRTALDSLPEHFRTPLTLHYFGGLNREETAQALGTPVATIAKQLSRGLERLRNKLGRAGFAVTSAGLIAMFSSAPSYAAPPALKASLLSVASERLIAASHQVGQRVIETKGASTLLTGAGFIKAAAIVVVAASGAILFVPHSVMTNPAPLPQVDLQKGLVGYWNLDENPVFDGTRMMDSSESGNFGTVTTDADAANKSVQGMVGRAVELDGKDDHINLGQPTSLLFTGAMTVSCWVKFNDLDGNYRLISKQGESDAARSWDLCMENFNPDVFGFYVSAEGNAPMAVDAQSAPADGPEIGVWTHIAGVFDPSTAVRLYKNGILVAENTTNIPAAQHVSNDEDIYIGANSRMWWDQINGAIDEVRIYNRALSGAEVSELANYPTSK
jgi:RNA polymerase sigma-70 factor (ECF subfamily)